MTLENNSSSKQGWQISKNSLRAPRLPILLNIHPMIVYLKLSTILLNTLLWIQPWTFQSTSQFQTGKLSKITTLWLHLQENSWVESLLIWPDPQRHPFRFPMEKKIIMRNIDLVFNEPLKISISTPSVLSCPKPDPLKHPLRKKRWFQLPLYSYKGLTSHSSS